MRLRQNEHQEIYGAVNALRFVVPSNRLVRQTARGYLAIEDHSLPQLPAGSASCAWLDTTASMADPREGGIFPLDANFSN